ncbi:dTDP-4-dehydrorhamnose 3,5-epimerase [bacterium]|nr:dTDP-4-dehydrorhamnose 3,5-epimerase [bacterium]
MLGFQKTDLEGVLVMEAKIVQDERGAFVKNYQAEMFREQGIDFTMQECFYSVSKKGVLRGMHFQSPPCDHAKMVFVPSGSIHDVVLDIRAGSPTYGRAVEMMLSGENRRSLYIPAGFAHGFLVESDQAIVVYQVSTQYAPDHDHGIRWDSFGYPWENTEPVVSERDRALPDWELFQTPFQYRG